MMPDRAGQASSIRNYRLVPSLFSRRLKLRFKQPQPGQPQTYQTEGGTAIGNVPGVKDLGKGFLVTAEIDTNEPRRTRRKGTNTSECGF